MDPVRIYEYLTLARGRIFDWARPLTPEQHAGEFPIGLGTLGKTLTHIMISEWYYVERMDGRDVPPYEEWPIRMEQPPPLATLEREWLAQATRTRAALRAPRDWQAALEYHVTDDDGHPMIVTTCAADIFTQLALHETHHRAQAMNMLRQLGVALEDIDFNALMYQRREA